MDAQMEGAMRARLRCAQAAQYFTCALSLAAIDFKHNTARFSSPTISHLTPIPLEPASHFHAITTNMTPEVLAVWVEVIQNFDGEDQSKIMAFITTISDAIDNEDNAAAYTLVQEVLRYQFEYPKINARLSM